MNIGEAKTSEILNCAMADIEIRRAFIDEKHRTENDKYERMIE